MFKNSLMYFNEKTKVDEVKLLLQTYDQLDKEKDKNEIYGLEGKLITIMKERIYSRYLRVAKECLKLRNDNFGFMLMSVNCILIELFYQLENGIDKTNDHVSNNKIEDAFKVVIPKLNSDFNKKTGLSFYKDVRCKLIHQAQTNKNVALSNETPTMIYPYKAGGYTVYNPELFFYQIEKIYKELFDEALNQNNKLLKCNIIEKVRNIAFKG
ncbi:hypothetical protein [Vagococcus hydrophili]|uniref:Uncharacterized protein n=1 Tax=Vagococcus hydrophili TaxID=2714947 RepID=A0A6G8AWN9_9ENTE|nr:hypothetical protein [Vagococcus hydrophili]QIL49474.1 hypothetical protein G7082_13680 [Vagococcus hydrophili]